MPLSAYPSLSNEDVDFLGRNVTNEEIKATLFHMAPLKALGSDGFQATFFQNQWDIIGDTICVWVKKVFGGVLYKLVMKVIANRFKSIFSKIFGQEQAGFIAGRSIIDNIIITQEVLHSMWTKRSLQWMAVNIDLEKTYDKVRWDFVEASLNTADIPSHLVKVIMNDISLSSWISWWKEFAAIFLVGMLRDSRLQERLL
ncbi:hypothetical protein PVK06_048191 [Gossypium arboreum]|uniref:Reverse transcriptase domain-containing protein n=1 Tax=Gossypium arboreum TaxID=29729 RepID=A0ABR0MH87_GOSAR|nr:hypothetical protein PVK06_048191 [Gossypium arboreum]